MPSEVTIDGTLFQYVAEPARGAILSPGVREGVPVRYRIGRVNAWRHGRLVDVDPTDDDAVRKAFVQYVRPKQ